MYITPCHNTPKMNTAVHDIFFKELYCDPRYSLDIFKLVLSSSEFALFDWKTLKSEVTSFIDASQREKRMDLTFSVKLKRSKNSAQILFLLEHKSRQDNDLLVQMLEYQAGIYRCSRSPVIPILVYHGKRKKWTGRLNFQDSLEGLTPAIKKRFKKNILDYTCRLLNIQELKVPKDAGKLVSAPALLILQQIWKLDAAVVEQFFSIGRTLSERDRNDLMARAINYIRKNDPSFDWKYLTEIEGKTIKKEGERIMFSLQDSMNEVREEGLKEGIKKGIEKGIEKGREEERRKLALSMLKDDFNIEVIRKHTNLSEAEIRRLANK